MINTTVYINPKSGWKNTEFSHSQWMIYEKQCQMKWKWQYPDGYKKKIWPANVEFGHAIEFALKRHYIYDKDVVEEFKEFWDKAKDKTLEYNKDMPWEKFIDLGVGMLEEFMEQKDSFPIFKPRFFDWKSRFIYTSPRTGLKYASIPDLIAQDADGKERVIDIKAYKSPINLGETPNILVMDSQLRTQAAATGIYRVGLWVFVKSKDKGTGKHSIQFLTAEMPKAHAIEAVESHLESVIRIQNGEIACNAGIRYPSSDCLKCEYRGLCLGKILGPRPEYTEITKSSLTRWDDTDM